MVEAYYDSLEPVDDMEAPFEENDWATDKRNDAIVLVKGMSDDLAGEHTLSTGETVSEYTGCDENEYVFMAIYPGDSTEYAFPESGLR